MKRYLLPEKGNFYKANMHMHSTVSDGKLSPEEIKRAYMEKGYSIVAYTDHEVLVPHTELSDKDFLAITAAELAFNLYHVDGGYPYVKTYHLNFYSKTPDKWVLPIWDPDLLLDCVKDKIPEVQKSVKYKREYGIEKVNEAIATAKADGFFVGYNHPTWSLQDYTDYANLQGIWGIECHNTASLRVGLVETDRPWNDLLANGNMLFPLAADDAHTAEDCFGGWITVKAENLEYTTVIDALERGDFYASTGPEIFELSIEDGIVHVRCSPVREIRWSTECRFAGNEMAKDGLMTEADLDIRLYLQHKTYTSPFRKPFVRFTLVDENGRLAYTRAYSLEELQ